MSAQPGYDALASTYDDLFPTGFTTSWERRAVDLFGDDVVAAGTRGTVVDVGCGTGHVTQTLAERDLAVAGLDPSPGMLAIARRHYPTLTFVEGDAGLRGLPDTGPLAGLLARFSLIHVDPTLVPEVLDAWGRRLRPDAPVLVAFQCSEDPASPVVEFDHKVARAWRWHPDAMAAALRRAGFVERWRLVTRPDAAHRFQECHLAATRVA